MKEKDISQYYPDPDDKFLARRIIDKAEQIQRSLSPRATDFLDPHQQEIAMQILRRYPDLTCRIFSGFPQAERARILMLPENWQGREPELLKFIAIEGNFNYQQVTHRDFLGAILSSSLKRDKLGDIIILGDKGAQVVVAAEAADYLLSAVASVHQVPVTLREIEQYRLSVRPPKEKEITGTVASLRLDAVASLGFSVSRSRIVPVIRGERIKINWRTETDPAAVVSAGDVISIPGRGRLEVVALEGKSHKGRIRIRLKKFV